MLIRLVKMTFAPEHVEQFRQVFNDSKERIRAFEGVNHLELWNDKDHPNIFFTYSIWDNAECLERYRRSELFKSVWSRTKVLFSDRPQAWSNHREVVLE